MKKIIAVIAVALLIVGIFAGCGEDNTGSDIVSDAEQAVTDAVDGAARAVTDAVEAPEQYAKEKGRMSGGLSERTGSDEEAPDGFVTDSDGIIGNGSNENRKSNSVVSGFDSSNNQDSSRGADNQSPTDSLM